MPKFSWTTEGSRCAGTVVSFPPSVMLLIIVSIAIGITMLMTSKVSVQEKLYQAKRAEYEDMINKRESPKTIPGQSAINKIDKQERSRSGSD